MQKKKSLWHDSGCSNIIRNTAGRLHVVPSLSWLSRNHSWHGINHCKMKEWDLEEEIHETSPSPDDEEIHSRNITKPIGADGSGCYKLQLEYGSKAVTGWSGHFRDTKMKSKLCSLEAPARLQTSKHEDASYQGRSTFDKPHIRKMNVSPLCQPQTSGEPVEIVKGSARADEESLLRARLRTQRSWSTESSRDEAWERKRDKSLLEEMKTLEENSRSRALGRSVSDCGDTAWSRQSTIRMRARTRSLTDDDLEELRGSIDLGFGFDSTEDPDLCNTLPALELCYAIARQFQDAQSKSSSPSISEKTMSTSACYISPISSPESVWRISSPGNQLLHYDYI
ncbi:hypothetical protein O6H91_09G030900 [Diphasiastrum complanatum]|uniref:Uncharacterized protein n=1 Tax=Diphasiastrum complanatum TaxID=34168 RepID=A0ACC2CMR9_DIPCM|nr:hypothetical protein O6H91_09G030900 [Diphasiastrum complanatum]